MSTVIDWDQSIKNLHSMFAKMEKTERNERDRKRRLKVVQKPAEPQEKAPPHRCAKCKRFCKAELCTKCT